MVARDLPSQFNDPPSLGAFLRDVRESRQMTLHTAAHAIHVRVGYLDAIEQGHLQALPDAVYVRGFIHRYADYLGLDGAALGQQWMAMTGHHPNRPTPRPKSVSKDRVIALRPLHLWAVYVGVVVVAVSGLSFLVAGNESPMVRWWTAWRERTTASQPLFETPQDWTAIPGVFPPDAATPKAAVPAVASPAPQPTTLPVTDDVQLAIRVVDRPSWVRVVADSRTVLEDTLQPGTEMSWSAKQSIVLRAGNAGGVLVTWNNQPQGVLGDFGEVKEIVFNRENP
ncbi:MAG: DUF4115 domain-containing protein [Synechococcales cyanobacterium]